jgi:hypothetical protein
MKSVSAVSSSSCSYCDAVDVKGARYLVPHLGTHRLVLGTAAAATCSPEEHESQRTLQQRTLWIADAHRVIIGPGKLPTERWPRARVIDGIFTTATILPSEQTCFLSARRRHGDLTKHLLSALSHAG